MCHNCNIDGLSKLSEDCFPRLETLDLAGNMLGDEGIQHLEEFPNWRPHEGEHSDAIVDIGFLYVE